MTGASFDTFARQLGRRRALQALGAAVVTAGGLTLAGAKNGKHTNGNKNKKQNKKIKKKALACVLLRFHSVWRWSVTTPRRPFAARSSLIAISVG